MRTPRQQNGAPQHIGPFFSLLLWASGRSGWLARRNCTKYFLHLDLGIGALVLCVGMIAAASGIAFLRTVTRSWWCVAGVMNGLIVVLIDRTLIAAWRKNPPEQSSTHRGYIAVALSIRFLLAALSGTAAAGVLEVAVLANDIARELALMNEETRSAVTRAIDTEFADIQLTRRQIEQLRQGLQERQAYRNALRQRALDEAAGMVGPGLTGKHDVGPVTNLILRQLRDVDEELVAFRTQTSAEITTLERTLAVRESQRQQRIEHSRAHFESVGFLAKRVALARLRRGDPENAAWVWIIRLWLCSLELAPLLVKLVLPYTVVDGETRMMEERAFNRQDALIQGDSLRFIGWLHERWHHRHVDSENTSHVGQVENTKGEEKWPKTN
jgi:hypothetical protein